MPRSKLSEGWKIVIGVSSGFVIGLVMSMKFDPTTSLVGGLSAAMVAWLIAQQF